jgi:hypothetical protein
VTNNDPVHTKQPDYKIIYGLSSALYNLQVNTRIIEGRKRK